MSAKLAFVVDDEPLADAVVHLLADAGYRTETFASAAELRSRLRDGDGDAYERAELTARWRSLTPRERQVFLHIVSGALNKEVAFHFGISEKTIKIHRAHVMEKMGAHSFADLVRMDERLRPGRPLTAG